MGLPPIPLGPGGPVCLLYGIFSAIQKRRVQEAAPYGPAPAATCSAKPGAVVEPHQRKFLQTQGPVAREEFRCPLRFCAPEILLHLLGTRPP